MNSYESFIFNTCTPSFVFIKFEYDFIIFMTMPTAQFSACNPPLKMGYWKLGPGLTSAPKFHLSSGMSSGIQVEDVQHWTILAPIPGMSLAISVRAPRGWNHSITKFISRGWSARWGVRKVPPRIWPPNS